MRSQIFSVVQFGELSMEDAMLKRMAILTIALIGVAGMAQAQSMSTAPAGIAGQSHEMQAMARTCGAPKKTVMKDEYGFRYDSRGDRLNAQGCVIAPPHMIPGAKVL
jgi:hypothetical protein